MRAIWSSRTLSRPQSRFYRPAQVLRSDRITKHVEDPSNTASRPFEFTKENWVKAQEILAKYPENYKRSALMPLLDLAQRQSGGWLPLAAMNKVAAACGVPNMAAYEVATFYTMYNRTPIGQYFVQVCGTTPCELRGASKIMSACKENLGVHNGETTSDKKFTLLEVECLGACVHAPMIQINDDYYEDLTVENTHEILNTLRDGGSPPTGSYKGRLFAEPVPGKTSLFEKPMGPYAPFLEKLDKEAAEAKKAEKK